jgi:hypothetical protein
VANFEVNSEPHTGARRSVRLCVGLTNPNGTEASASGRSVRACVARESKREESSDRAVVDFTAPRGACKIMIS